MPTMSKPRQDVEEAFDLRSMSRLHEHPSLRPLYAHQVALHQQRATLVDEVRLLRQQLHDVPSGEGFTAATSRPPSRIGSVSGSGRAPRSKTSSSSWAPRSRASKRRCGSRSAPCARKNRSRCWRSL